MAHLKHLLLFLWVGVTVSTAVDVHKRVLGGKDCQNNERLYHVKLILIVGDDEGFCGGSVINPYWILTAAHCLPKGGIIDKILGAGGYVHPDRDKKVTPVIFGEEKGDPHDLMLLKLSTPFKDQQPVDLPDCSYRPITVQIAGHGSKEKGSNNEREPGESSTLQCADTKLVDCKDKPKELMPKFKNLNRFSRNAHWICAKAPGKDICFGDSGGGVVQKEKGKPDKIYGVNAFAGYDFVCQEPTVFMDLCHPEYEEWIKTTMKKAAQDVIG